MNTVAIQPLNILGKPVDMLVINDPVTTHKHDSTITIVQVWIVDKSSLPMSGQVNVFDLDSVKRTITLNDNIFQSYAGILDQVIYTLGVEKA